jgi:type II secretory pathway component PulC
MDYYAEVLDSPQRLIQVFDSMKPLRDPNRRITGYRLGIEGEAEFWKSVGLQEGDVVRRVNSIRLRNRRVAESFIKQFVSGKANVFVLDLERAGKPYRHIYQVR